LRIGEFGFTRGENARRVSGGDDVAPRNRLSRACPAPNEVLMTAPDHHEQLCRSSRTVQSRMRLHQLRNDPAIEERRQCCVGNHCPTTTVLHTPIGGQPGRFRRPNRMVRAAVGAQALELEDLKKGEFNSAREAPSVGGDRSARLSLHRKADWAEQRVPSRTRQRRRGSSLPRRS